MYTWHMFLSLLSLKSTSIANMWKSSGLILFVLFVAACGNTPDESSSASGANGQDDSLTTFNPCDLLTIAEVESIFGEAAATDYEPTSAGPVRSCSFRNEAGGRFFLLQLAPETVLDVDTEAEGATPIPDLGDEAVFFSGMLRVRVGEEALQVTTWHPSSKQDEALAMVQEIARLALDRLP